MKKIVMLLFVAFAAIGCSKDDEAVVTPTPTPVNTNTMKIYNKVTGAEIKDGDIVVFNSNTYPANTLKFYFKNTSSSAIKVRSRFISVSGVPNADNVQYCIGENCLASISAGSNYPVSNSEVLTVPANGTLGDIEQYKMENSASPLSPATKIDYVFEFYQYDADLNEVGNKIRFTYRYQP